MNYREYLRKITDLAKQVKRPETGTSYPENINTSALRALFDNLEVNHENLAADPPVQYGGNNKKQERADKAVELDKAIRSVKKAGWRGNHFKEREVKLEIKKVIGGDEEMIDSIFEVVKNQHEY